MFRIKKISQIPVRFGLFKKGILLFSISKSILKTFNLSLELDFFIDSNQVEEIKQKEKINLQLEMFDYLSKSEKSPYHLNFWLEKRKLCGEWVETLTEKAIEAGFLSRKRYLERYLEKRIQQGKPFWIVKQEIKALGLILNDLETINYDDKIAIDHLLKRKGLKKKATKASELKNFLLKKGFRYGVIEDYLNQLSES